MLAGSREQFTGPDFVKSGSALARFAPARPLAFFFSLAYAWGWTVWLVVPRMIDQTGLERGTSMRSKSLPFWWGAFGPTVAADDSYS